MKRDLILHIGTTKTGSTSIQHVLSRNRPALTAQGVCYPRSPGDAQHQLMAYAAMADHEARDELATAIWGGMAPAVRVELFLREFGEEMRDLPPEITRVIISTEFIYIRLHTTEEVRALRELLLPWFENIKVVVYLRRQDAHFTSLYTQILRTGEVLEADKRRMKARPLHELDYAKLLNRWATVFGTENVVPRLFEKQDGKRFDAVADFAALCGITLPATSAEVTQESNQSMNLAGQQLLVDLGRMLQDKLGVVKVTSPVWRVLTDAVTHAAPGRGWQPTRAKARDFYETFAAGNEEVRRIWFPGRAALFDDDFSDYPESAPAATQEVLYETACRTVLHIAGREAERGLQVVHESVSRAKATGNPGQLRAALKRAIRVDRKHVGLRLTLAELMIEDGDLRAARGLVDAALEMAPSDETAQRLHAQLVPLEADGAASPAPVTARDRRARRKERLAARTADPES